MKKEKERIEKNIYNDYVSSNSNQLRKENIMSDVAIQARIDDALAANPPPPGLSTDENELLITGVKAVAGMLSSLPAACLADPYMEEFLRNHFEVNYLGLRGQTLDPQDNQFLAKECGTKLTTPTTQIDMLLRGAKDFIKRLGSEGLDWMFKIILP